MKKEFYEKTLFLMPNYLFNFVLNTIYFLLCNILLIIFFVITSITPNSFSFLLFFICLIPFAPSFSTLYYCISKLISEKDIYSYSYFWSFLKSNFISSFKIYTLELFLLLVFIADFQFFYLNMPETKLHLFFAILIILLVSLSFYTLCINTFFIFKAKDILVMSIYFMIKKLPIVFMKFIAIFLSYSLVNNISIILLPFIPALLCTVFYLYDITTIKEIKSKYTKNFLTE
jgi:hypothetical protein